jgi:hypothetical protein
LLYAGTRERSGVFHLPFAFSDFDISNPAYGLRRAILWVDG